MRSTRGIPRGGRCLLRGQGLLSDQFAVEPGMFGEVADEQVPAGARNSHRVAGGRGVADRCRVESLGESIVQAFQRPEISELLGVAVGVGVRPSDHVATVRSVFTHGPDELLPARQRRRQFVTEPPRVLAGESVLAIGQRQNQSIAVGRLSTDRFLDQPPADGFLYPRGMSGKTS